MPKSDSRARPQCLGVALTDGPCDLAGEESSMSLEPAAQPSSFKDRRDSDNPEHEEEPPKVIVTPAATHPMAVSTAAKTAT